MKKPEELLAEVGKIALKSNFKPATAIIMGASSLIAIALIERYSPRVSKVVKGIVKAANLHVNMPIYVELPTLPAESIAELAHKLPTALAAPLHVTPLSRHPEGHAVPLCPRTERQEGRSEVIREIAVGKQN
jgi:hypothetical protein